MNWRRLIKSWLPLAAAITLISGLIYVAVQQDIRIGANDPQAEMAKEAVLALENKQMPQNVVPVREVEMSQSLSPYLIVYDAAGKVAAANVSLHGQTPVIPDGVLEYARAHGEDRISWQPEAGVRSAVVVMSVAEGKGGFVLAGRSMREIEAHIAGIEMQVGVGWLATLALTFLLAALLEWLPFLRS